MDAARKPRRNPAAREPGRSLTEHAYEKLKEEILRVQRRPGELLGEAELATRYGMSKTPVREALRLLARDGWIVVLPRKGYLVQPLRLDDVREIFAVRQIIEPSLAARAATSSGIDVARLDEFVARQAAAVDDLPAALQAAREFHLAIVDFAGNLRLTRIVTDLLDEIRRLHFLLPEVESHITSQEELRAHRDLVACLAAGQGEKAAEVMTGHLAEVARTLVRGFSGI